MLPRVILHTATSLDGRITNFPADLELYYTLAAQWNPDAILFGSSTILAAPTLEVPAEHRKMFTPPADGPDPRPLMVIADSRGRVRCWETLRSWPYMRDLIALCSGSTPDEYLDYLRQCRIGVIRAGEQQVDMRAALEELNRQFGVRTIRVDSGGTLNSVLLHEGLVDEISILVHPFIAGGRADPTLCDPLHAGIRDLQVPLTHRHTEVLGNGIVWSRYTPQKTG
ncbi:RibD family protein [Methanoregula sp.]|uniref:RibD family protein n=1 Tax=Methanoregula sp. TaxID=2052170 RepID=UPI002371C124|nr:RibD family protein [Methanoregula sp.]MDD1687534.1 RibD family protein [Methanoregula sp.]